MERSGAFRGRYVVLGGGIPLHADGTEVDIRLARLRDRVSRDARVLREIIVGMPLTPEGEHTADYVREAILRALGETDVPITTLGRGLSTGSELEYADAETLRFALMGRK
jgi:recombination protein RecR